jgi:hypothetical protein
MASSAFHGLFDIQSSPDKIASPAATLKKSNVQEHGPPPAIELDAYEFGKQFNGPAGSSIGVQTSQEPPLEAQIPKTPNELEMSRPSSPRADEAVGKMQSWNDPPMNKWRILSCCLIYFGNGINDSGM